MPRLPVASGRDVVRALQRASYVLDRQSGTHVTLRHESTGRSVTVPVHGSRDLPRGTLRGIITDAGLTVDEFRQLLK